MDRYGRVEIREASVSQLPFSENVFALVTAVETHFWWPDLLSFNLLPGLKSLRIPAPVITGDHEFIPSSTAEHISQALPNARMVTLKDCGHFTYLECPVAARKQIDALVRSKVKPALRGECAATEIKSRTKTGGAACGSPRPVRNKA